MYKWEKGCLKKGETKAGKDAIGDFEENTHRTFNNP
jgi:hypothetical protein